MGGEGSGRYTLYPGPPCVRKRQDTIVLGRCLNWCDLLDKTWLFCDAFWQAVSEALNDTSITKVRCNKYTVGAVMLAGLRREKGGERNGKADGL